MPWPCYTTHLLAHLASQRTKGSNALLVAVVPVIVAAAVKPVDALYNVDMDLSAGSGRGGHFELHLSPRFRGIKELKSLDRYLSLLLHG